MKVSYQDALAFYRIDGAHPGGFPLTKKILSMENINRRSVVLEAGCGTGQTAAYLAKKYGCRVYAVDQHPQMINAAKNRFVKEKVPVKIMKASIEDLPFADGQFDFIIAESSTAFTKISSALQQYYRVLNQKGTLLNIDIAAEIPLTKEEKNKLLKFYGFTDIWTEKEWLKNIAAAGFRNISVEKKLTVFQGLEEYAIEENNVQTHNFDVKTDPAYEDVMNQHYEYLAAFGERLGYRVFKARK
ncbi:class I SAM-dependent methyltransferase [Peribacillus sp. SCS-155]|uniref:class I SAM-dependent methyltransferase n=1 Tax=Peribacillus sedimenti TaxID=3115297 RepID=UPI00390675D8